MQHLVGGIAVTLAILLQPLLYGAHIDPLKIATSLVFV
jgi:hypothetical protein